jgi:hypothetical protein
MNRPQIQMASLNCVLLLLPRHQFKSRRSDHISQKNQLVKVWPETVARAALTLGVHRGCKTLLNRTAYSLRRDAPVAGAWATVIEPARA